MTSTLLDKEELRTVVADVLDVDIAGIILSHIAPVGVVNIAVHFRASASV